MSDTTELVRGGSEDELQLVVAYLRHELDPEQAAAVEQRLRDDVRFLEFAAPFLLAWKVTKPWERAPRPEKELEDDWNEFTKRAGFIHQRRAARKRWLTIIGIAIVALGVAGFTLRGRVREWYEDRRDYVDVPWRAGWIALPNGAEVKLDPGAHLRTRRTPRGDIQDVKLRGVAEFRAAPTQKPGDLIPTVQPVAIVTAGCIALGARGEFRVSARGDTTEVDVHKPEHPFWVGFITIPTKVMLGDAEHFNPLSVNERQRGRCVRGQAPTLEKTP